MNNDQKAAQAEELKKIYFKISMSKVAAYLKNIFRQRLESRMKIEYIENLLDKQIAGFEKSIPVPIYVGGEMRCSFNVDITDKDYKFDYVIKEETEEAKKEILQNISNALDYMNHSIILSYMELFQKIPFMSQELAKIYPEINVYALSQSQNGGYFLYEPDAVINICLSVPL